MSKYTLLEIHLDGSSITANAPFSNAEDPETTEDGRGSDDDSDEGGLPVVPIVALLAVLAVVAVAAKKLLSGEVPDDLEVDAEAEIDVE